MSSLRPSISRRPIGRGRGNLEPHQGRARGGQGSRRQAGRLPRPSRVARGPPATDHAARLAADAARGADLCGAAASGVAGVLHRASGGRRCAAGDVNYCVVQHAAQRQLPRQSMTNSTRPDDAGRRWAIAAKISAAITEYLEHDLAASSTEGSSVDVTTDYLKPPMPQS
jgi:hypothetical protein